MANPTPQNEKDNKRHVSIQDIASIASKAPKSCVVWLFASSSDQECKGYALEIANKLMEAGFGVKQLSYGDQLTDSNYDPRFYLKVGDDKKTAMVVVYVLRK
jgi:hypothetical protein